MAGHAIEADGDGGEEVPAHVAQRVDGVFRQALSGQGRALAGRRVVVELEHGGDNADGMDLDGRLGKAGRELDTKKLVATLGKRPKLLRCSIWRFKGGERDRESFWR